MTQLFEPWGQKPLPLPSNERPSSAILQNVATSRMIFKSNGSVWSIRTRATVGSSNGLRTHRRASASRSQSVAISSRDGNWDRTIERTQPLVALVRSLFSHSEGHRLGLMNLFGSLSARSSSFLSRVHDSNQPSRGVFHRFEVSKVLSSSALHANIKAWSKKHDAQRNSAFRTGA